MSARSKRAKRTKFPVRRMASKDDSDSHPLKLMNLYESVNYTGNPQHKRNPGDFGLSPPAQPRPDKSLCDDVGIFDHATAERLLKSGADKGLISRQKSNGYPRIIWSVTDDGKPVEARLENADRGTYHGYPMPQNDPFRHEVLKRWKMP